MSERAVIVGTAPTSDGARETVANVHPAALVSRHCHSAITATAALESCPKNQFGLILTLSGACRLGTENTPLQLSSIGFV